jgi:hypothetical protein
MSMQAFDHPRATRYNVKLSTVIVKYHASGNSGRIAEGRNISKNGMAIILPHDIQVGSRVHLTLPVLGEPMHFEGVIRNRDHFTYGVAFVDTAEEQRTRLANYCSAMALATAAL